LSARSLSKIVVLVLVLLGTLVITARYQARELTQLALANSLWRLTYNVSFEAEPKMGEQEATTLVELGRPYSTSSVEVVQEDISESNPSLSVERWESSVSGNREFRITTRHAGKYAITTEFDLYLHASDSWNGHSHLESLSPVRRRNFTRSEEEYPTKSSRIGKVLQRAPGSDATGNEKLQWIHAFCLNDLERASDDDEGDDVLWALAAKRTSPLGRAKVFVTLCRAMNLPARLVAGFELRQTGQAKPHVWAEVHRENRWIPFDPVNGFGFAQAMPKGFVPIRRGGKNLALAGQSVVRAVDAKNVVVNYSILRLPPDKQLLRAEVRRPAQIFDLTRLPLRLHGTLALMLLLPLGALITAILRNIVGLKTLGTFAPALLAMSFIYASWGTALVILTVVIIVGLLGRSMLEKLHLLMVPRLSIVLTIIILCVVFAVSVLNYWLPEESAQSVLIPLVILTILIERFFVTSEEDGTSYAVQLVLGTVVVGAFCFLLLRSEAVGHLVLTYPEIHFFTIAAFIIIGRYTGYRLTELWRFRDLAKDKKELDVAVTTQVPGDKSST